MASTLGLATLVIMTLGFFLAVPLVLVPATAAALWLTRRYATRDAEVGDRVVVRRGAEPTEDQAPVRAVRAA